MCCYSIGHTSLKQQSKYGRFASNGVAKCMVIHAGTGGCSHTQKRVRQIKKKMVQGLLDPEKEDMFSLFVAGTDITYCYYHESERILGRTFGMCVLQVHPPLLLCPLALGSHLAVAQRVLSPAYIRPMRFVCFGRPSNPSVALACLQEMQTRHASVSQGTTCRRSCSRQLWKLSPGPVCECIATKAAALANCCI